MKGTSFGILLLAFCATWPSIRVLAEDPLGFYVGAAIGESHVRTAKEILGDTNYDYEFDAQHSAWKVTAGRIGGGSASPDLISLGVTWTF